MSKEKIEYEMGSGNVFKDLQIPNPEEYLAKAHLVFIIEDLMDERDLRLDEAARILNLSAAKLSTILDGLLDDFSVDHLFSLIRTLDCSIETGARGITTTKYSMKDHISIPEPSSSPLTTISLIDPLGKPSSLKIAVAA